MFGGARGTWYSKRAYERRIKEVFEFIQVRIYPAPEPSKGSRN